MTVGHFQYWHTDTLGTVQNGQQVTAGQTIGWTCKGLWHVHLSEVQTVDGVETYVNPLHPGGKIDPLEDTLAPLIHEIRFYTPAFSAWRITNNTRWAPDAGTRLARTNLHGFVDVRALIGDPQSFEGYWVRHPELRTELHVYRGQLRVTRHRGMRPVVDQGVFQANAFLEAGLPPRGLPVIFDYHFAPGTSENIPAADCENHLYVPERGPTCRGAYWLRLFTRANGAAWDTSRYADGRYTLEVGAWDAVGNKASRRLEVALHNQRRSSDSEAARPPAASPG